MNTKINYTIVPSMSIPFSNNTDYCVGTGRMGLALQKAYVEQLALVQEHIGFKHIRGHGLFCDDMAIYQTYEENGVTKHEYNFTYLDMVVDSYLSLGIKPFLELGFMPQAMASGEQTIFYWKGNVTPPKDYKDWNELVKATLTHLCLRYGADEATTWPIEVWNEPNLAGFWKDADMQEYFRLFKETFFAVKCVDMRFQVGGPAICGVDPDRWLQAFLEFCDREKIPLDSVTRHHYTIDLPEFVGKYGYPVLREADETILELESSRKIVDSFPAYKDLPMHITEFNTSYNPRTPIHDTNQHAAYIARLLARMGETSASYSYWTFGDIFEELGIPSTPFHGGFGLVANGLIPKPTFWTFAFFKKLQGKCLHKSENAIITQEKDGSYAGVAYNLCMAVKEDITLNFILPADNDATYSLVTRTVDEVVCNPLKVWNDIGQPANPSKLQVQLLKDSAYPPVGSGIIRSLDGEAVIEIDVRANAVVGFEIRRIEIVPDRGFDYERL
jgi:xylan 1,4-beta-xylosidase